MMDIEKLRKCIADGNLLPFYNSKPWRRLRTSVLMADNYECQICKQQGKYTRADHVHHINYVRDRPDFALSATYQDAHGVQRRNLISVCKRCHETVCHPERLPYNGKRKEPPITPERW